MSERIPYPDRPQFPEGFTPEQVATLREYARAKARYHLTKARIEADDLRELVNSPIDETPEQFRERTGSFYYAQRRFLGPDAVTKAAAEIRKEEARERGWEALESECNEYLDGLATNARRAWFEAQGKPTIEVLSKATSRWGAENETNIRVHYGDLFVGTATAYGKGNNHYREGTDAKGTRISLGSYRDRANGREAAAEALLRHHYETYVKPEEVAA